MRSAQDFSNNPSHDPRLSAIFRKVCTVHENPETDWNDSPLQDGKRLII